jgi:glycosyltransferase involved in cell wall biosynthesis
VSNVVVMLGIYNVEKTIIRTLDSIIDQDFDSYRVIISENHSTDRTKEILSSYSNKITIISPPSHFCGEEHWNFCLDYLERLEDADYAALYHGDDIYDKSIIGSQIKFLNENPDAPMVFTDALIVDEDYSTIGWSYSRRKGLLSSKYTLEEVLYGMISSEVTCICPTAMIRLNILRKEKRYRFNPTMFSKAADYGLWLEIIGDYGCVGILHRPLVKYRKCSTSDSASTAASLEESPAFKIVTHYIGVNGEYKYSGWRWGAHIERIQVQDYLRQLKNAIRLEIYPRELIAPRLTVRYVLISASSLSGIYNLLTLLFVKLIFGFVPRSKFRTKVIDLSLNQGFVIFTRKVRHFFSR